MSGHLKKKDLRRKYAEKRRSLSKSEFDKKSESLGWRLINHLEHLKAQNVFAFFPFNGEPNIRDILLAHNKNFSLALPVVETNIEEMDFLPWSSDQELVLNQFGIPQPPKHEESVPLSPDEATVILIPALAIDRSGYRLGYGGGYYDRYLFAYPMSKKIGVIFEDFFVDELPRDEWDISLDYVVTDQSCCRVK